METRQIKDFPNYSVSDTGRVFRIRDGFELSTTKQQHKGYAYCELYNNGKSKRKLVHRLVAEAFLPRESPLQQVNHKDGDKFNNNVTNLEWTTIEENLKHAVENDLSCLAKLTKEQVESLFGDTKKFLESQAEKYGVGVQTIKRIMEKPGLFYRR